MTDATPTPPADGTPPPPPAAPVPPAAAAQPAPPAAPQAAPAAGTAPQAPPAAPAPRPANPGSATTVIWRRRDRATLIGAVTAVVVAWVIELVRQLVILIQGISISLDEGIGEAFGAFGDFFFYGLWRPLFFFGLAFVALWLLLPIVKESALGVVLKRAALAGVAGFVGLLVFGLVTAIVNVARFGFAVGYFGVDFLWQPLLVAFGLTVSLLVGATIAWLRASRPPKAAPAAPAAPGAPAVPTP